MNKERISFYANLTLTLFGVGIAVYLFFKYLFVALLPFLISWAAAFLLRPAVSFLSKKSRIPKKIISVALTILCVAVGLGLIVLFFVFAVREAWEFLSSIASDGRVLEVLTKITNPIGALFGESEGAGALSEHIGEAVSEGISGLVSRLVSLLSSIAASIPGVLFFILVTVISSVYFALDLDRINSAVKRILPEKAVRTLLGIKKCTFSVGVKYLRSYLIIMAITFAVMLSGLLILRVENAFLLSVIIAALDLLPIIGVGTVLVPWSVAELILGNTGMGVALILLLVFHELVRQFAEPKIIGKSIGVHPIVSLILLYAGYCVFGFLGILLVPVIAVALNIFFDRSEERPKVED